MAVVPVVVNFQRRMKQGRSVNDVGVADWPDSVTMATLRGSMETSIAKMTWPSKPTMERPTWMPWHRACGAEEPPAHVHHLLLASRDNV